MNTSETSSTTNASQVPLYIDLDGTLLRSDMLLESVLVLLKSNPLYIFMLPVWLYQGKAYLKYMIASRVDIDVSTLPYHSTFLDYLRAEAASGRALYLASASTSKLVNKIAGYLGIFQGVLASDEKLNLSGQKKLAAIEQHNKTSAFDYAGNSRVDMGVWVQARKAIVVNPNRGILNAVDKTGKLGAHFDDRKNTGLSVIKAIRVHQWLKNMLIFVPVLTAHQWHESNAVLQASLAVLAFSFTASSVYVLNDILDLAADRAHPRKCFRPFASGDISIMHGLMMIPVLLVAGFFIAGQISTFFLLCLATYYAITLAYSLRLKSVLVIDVIVLACLYTIRIIAGMIAIDVPPSFWLIAFSMFIFFSLAILKRCAELNTASEHHKAEAWGRKYLVSDKNLLYVMGVTSGYIAVLVLALFIHTPDVAQRYSQPIGLWLLGPLVLFWVSYMWFKVWRGEQMDDPLVFAIMDRGSQLMLLASVVVILLSI